MKNTKIRSAQTARRLHPTAISTIRLDRRPALLAAFASLALMVIAAAPAQAQCSRGSGASVNSDPSGFASDGFRSDRSSAAIAAARFRPAPSPQTLASAQLRQLAATQSAKRDIYRAKVMPTRLAWAEMKRQRRSQRTAARIGADPDSLYRETRSAGSTQLAAHYAKAAGTRQ